MVNVINMYVCLLIRRASVVEEYPSAAEKGWLEKIMPKKDPVQILKWCVRLASSPGHSHVFNVTRRKGGGLGFLRATLKTGRAWGRGYVQ